MDELQIKHVPLLAKILWKNILYGVDKDKENKAGMKTDKTIYANKINVNRKKSKKK